MNKQRSFLSSHDFLFLSESNFDVGERWMNDSVLIEGNVIDGWAFSSPFDKEGGQKEIKFLSTVLSQLK